jgi:AAA ATPase domain/Adenylate and Guanylate cyclase catalytic domain
MTVSSGETLAARVGIATGLVMVGDLVGEGAAQEQAVVGETPNLAARLQTLAQPGNVVISQGTRRLLGSVFQLTDLGPQHLRGFAEPLTAWRVEGEGRAEGRFEARQSARLTPLVGREEEIALLLRRWRQARDGEGQVVLLLGEPGIGKSRLVRETRERLEDDPHSRVLYQCSPHHTTSPLHPVIEQLERAAGFSRADRAEDKLTKLETLLARGTDKLDEAVSLVAALFGIAGGKGYTVSEMTPQRQKQRTLEVLVEQLAGLSANQPVLLAYEDVHWIDPTTQELLGLAIERIQRLAVLAIITFRPEFEPPWAGLPHVSAVALTRLGRRDGTAMVGQVVGDKALPDEVTAQIVGKTDGVPLFLEELTKTVLESGLLQEAGERYELSGPLPTLAIPSTLHDSLLARLDRLAPVKEVAQIGAVIGRDFSRELLVAVSPWPEDKLGGALDQLVASELVFRRGTVPDATYSFKHALVQDVAYQSLLKSKRQQLHARIAAVLEDRFRSTVEAQPELLAQHYAGAGRTLAAAREYAKAAQANTAKGAGKEALALAVAGLGLFDELPDGQERSELETALLLARGDALRLVEGTAAPATGEAYRRARQLSVRLDASAALSRAIYGECLHHYNRAEFDEAYALALQLLEMYERDGSSASRKVALEVAALSSFSLGELTRARRFFEQFLSALQPGGLVRSGGWRWQIGSEVYFAWDLLLLGYPGEARRRTEAAIAAAEHVGEPFGIAYAVGNAPFVFDLLRDGCRLREVVDRLHDVAEAACLPHWTVVADWLRTFLLVHEGGANEAIPKLRAGIETSLAQGYAIEVPYYLTLLSEACLVAGRFDDARKSLDQAIERSERTGERWVEPELYRRRAQLRLADPAGDDAGATSDLRRALKAARAMNARFWELRAACDLARLRAHRGERQEAYDLLAPVYGWFTEGFDTADLQDARALLDALK